MDNLGVEEGNNSRSSTSSSSAVMSVPGGGAGEEIVEPGMMVSSSTPTAIATPMENDNSHGGMMVQERNRNNQNRNSDRCLEPAVRMILPRRTEVTPFRRPRDFDALKSEEARLDTFSQPPGWPIPFIRPEDCARAGFFFLMEDDDKVQCAFCQGVVGEWEQGDTPMAEHRRHFPLCPFILGLPVGNVPLGQEGQGEDTEAASNSQEEEAAGVDVCGPFARDLSQLSLASDQTASVRGAQPLAGNGNEAVTSLGIKTCGNGPVNRNLVTLHSRISTFTSWPVGTGQTPEAMAEAGFFYIGRRDDVRCFYCDGGLRNWEATQDPWLEHARWFPNCTYVILNKGDDFVEEVNKAKANPREMSQQDPSLTNGNPPPPRRVSAQELRELVDSPIVKPVLEMGMDLVKVKSALQRKIQQTGQPFLTTEALLEAVLGRDSEYESDPDSEADVNDEEENLSPAPRQEVSHRPNNTPSSLNITSDNGTGSGISAEISSSSSENPGGSGDEETRSGSGDSGVESPSAGCSSSGEDENGQMTASSSEKGPDIEEEIRKLREQTLCKICMDQEVGIVFLPCGHLVSCTSCATALSNCALCRQPIQAVVRTYLS